MQVKKGRQPARKDCEDQEEEAEEAEEPMCEEDEEEGEEVGSTIMKRPTAHKQEAS